MRPAPGSWQADLVDLLETLARHRVPFLVAGGYAVAHAGHHVTFGDMATGAFKKTLRVPNPRGIAVSVAGDELVINFGSPPRAARVRADTLTPVEAEGNRRGYLSLATGSHITLV